MIVAFLLLFAGTLLCQTPEIPTALPAGRLLFFLHEDAALNGESPTQKNIGPITIRTATALHQKPGILIVSPQIWHNLLYRKQWFDTQLKNTGSLTSLFYTAWTAHQHAPSPKTYAQIQTLLKTDQTLLHHLYLWQTDFSDWLCFVHTVASVIILIPRLYLEERQELLPRMLPSTYQHNEFATGLTLNSCTPHTLPTHHDELAHAINEARHLHKRSSFSIENLESLFLKKTTIHPLLTIRWNIYISGHGTYTPTESTWSHLSKKQSSKTSLNHAHMCGLSLAQFVAWLTLCNTKLSVGCIYYQSCYGGGKNFAEMYTALRAQHTVLSPHNQLSFPLIAGGLGDAPTTMIMPRKHMHHNNLALSIGVDVNFPEFFSRLEKPGIGWAEILQPLASTLSSPSDIHGLSNTPQILFPGHTELTPIDVTSKTHAPPSHTTALQHIIRAGIYIITPADEQEKHKNHQPYIIRGKRAVLVTTSRIANPLEIHPYQKIERGKKAHTIFKAPALISLIPGNALHHYTDITLHSLGLKDFITHSFLDFTNQKSTKVFLIDSLTLSNDLKQNFTGEPDSLWSALKTTLTNWFSTTPALIDTPRITLEKVIIMVAAEKISCVFLLTDANKTTHAHKTLFSRPSSSMPLPEKLTLEALSQKDHTQLYKKYLKLCSKQEKIRAAA